MKSTPASTLTRPGLSGTAALPHPSHDHLMPPPKPLRRILTGLATALALGLFTTPVFAAEFIQNGSFEDGTPAPSAVGGQIQVALGNTANLPHWTASTAMGWYFKYTAWGKTAPLGAGERLFNFNGITGSRTLSQSFAVAAGTEYTVSYHESYRGNGGKMNTTLSVAAGTVSGAAGSPVAVDAGPAASIVQMTASNINWTLHSFKFTPDTTTTATLTFGNWYTGVNDGLHGDNDGVFLDNVSVTGAAGLTATTTTLALGSGTNPSTYGDAVPFFVTVAENGGPGIPTGTLTLKDGGASGTTIGTGTLAVDGTCTITPAATALAVGTHADIVAVYDGDLTYAEGTSNALSHTVNLATPLVTVTVGSYAYNGSAQGPNSITTSPVSTGAVTYSYEGTAPTLYGPDSNRPTNVGTYTVTVTVAADSNCNGASSVPTAFTIDKGTPLITWITPGSINADMPLGDVELNATSGGVAGSFVYDPSSGTLLSAGTQTLSVQFTPANTANYNTPAAKTVTIKVNAAGTPIDAYLTDSRQIRSAANNPPFGAGLTQDVAALNVTYYQNTGISPGQNQEGAYGAFAGGTLNGIGFHNILLGNDSGVHTGDTVANGLAGVTMDYSLSGGSMRNMNYTVITGPDAAVAYHVSASNWFRSGADTTTLTLHGLTPNNAVYVQLIGGEHAWHATPSVSLNGGTAVAWTSLSTTVSSGNPALLGITGATDATGNLLITMTGPNYYGLAAVTVAQALGGSASSYATWATAQTPPLGDASVVGPDGLSNLLIYALAGLNTNHTNGSPGTLAGNVLSFAKRTDAVSNGDVTYAIEVSADLGGNDAWHVTTTGVSSNDASISIDLSALSGSTHFARLLVTQQ